MRLWEDGLGLICVCGEKRNVGQCTEVNLLISMLSYKSL